MRGPRRLNIDNINPHVRATKYAVRGELSIRSEELNAALAKESCELPFNKIICANIGNPQELGQKPITFFRQVLSLLEYPPLLESENVLSQLGYKRDVFERARWLLQQIGSVGSYSPSRGIPAIKESVARFIESRTPNSPFVILLNHGFQDGTAILLTQKTYILLQVPPQE